MRLLIILLFMINVAFATDLVPQQGQCEQSDYITVKDNIQDIQKVITHDALKARAPYYMYLETKELEDLQEFKNCIDYFMCGKYDESIVDDPANFRMHIWKSMEPDELTNLIRSCPVKDLAKKLVVRYKDQKGKKIDVSKIKPWPKLQGDMAKKGNPAIFHQTSQQTAMSMVKIVDTFNRAGKISNSHATILTTWGIELHGYSLIYTGEKGNYAVTQHKDKTIKYGRDWIDEPCDHIRMIRHEAEHVAQMKMANSCPDHNFKDHQKRERAAHLNDARFIKTVCPNMKAGDSVHNFCLERFRKNYMNVK